MLPINIEKLIPMKQIYLLIISLRFLFPQFQWTKLWSGTPPRRTWWKSNRGSAHWRTMIIRLVQRSCQDDVGGGHDGKVDIKEMHLKMVATQQIADIVELAEVLLLYKENQLPETDRSIRETYPRTQNLIFISFSPQTDSLTLTLKMKQQMNYWLLQELSHAKKGIKVGKCWTHLPKVQNIKGYWHWHWILRVRARNMNYGEYFLGGSSIKCTALKTTAFP